MHHKASVIDGIRARSHRTSFGRGPQMAVRVAEKGGMPAKSERRVKWTGRFVELPLRAGDRDLERRKQHAKADSDESTDFSTATRLFYISRRIIRRLWILFAPQRD